MTVPLPSKGEVFEARVARLLTAEGAFVRRRVNLEAQFGQRFSTITDVDVLAFRFAPDLTLSVAAGECKTTEAKSQPGVGDRLLWLGGLRGLVDADTAFLATTKRATDAIRYIAATLDCLVVDEADLAHREAIVALGADSAYGSHDPRLMTIESRVYAAAKQDEELKRAYWFCRSEVWLAPPPIALKRALGALRLLGGRWSARLPEPERVAVEWLAGQSFVGLVLAMVRLASVAYRQPEETFDPYLRERLAEGLADYGTLQEIAKAVDRYVVGVLSGVGLDPALSVGAMGAFAPQPPAYAEPLHEVIQRLARQPISSGQLAQEADLRYARRFLPELHMEAREERTDVTKLLRLIAAFVERQARVPAYLLEPIRSVEPDETRASPSSAESKPMDEPVGTLFPTGQVEGGRRRSAG